MKSPTRVSSVTNPLLEVQFASDTNGRTARKNFMHVNTAIKPLAKGHTARFMSRLILGISLMRVNSAIKGLATHLISNGTNLFTVAKSLLLVSSVVSVLLDYSNSVPINKHMVLT